MKITYDTLRREVGRYLGFKRSPADWSSDEIADVADVLSAGQRVFYWPSVVEGVPPHQWSFLREVATVSLVASQDDYSLPADFVRMSSSFTYDVDSREFTLTSVDEVRIRALRSNESLDGSPVYFAVRARPQSDNGYEAMFYPRPDDTVTVTYMYEKQPALLSDANTSHLGPAAHSQTLLLACLMEADRVLNPEEENRFSGRFMAAMQASIALDMGLSEADE